MTPDLTQRLQALVGRELTSETPAQDEVNLPMIRHWTEAMGDANPVHLDADAARATGRKGVVAPPTMLQAWTMRGYAAHRDGVRPAPAAAELTALLDEGGFTSVVATDSEQEYVRELRLGDRISVTEVVEEVSPRKSTSLGEGHFVTSCRTYRDAAGETVGIQRWRTLRYRPPAAPRPRRPRPALNQDNAFWFEACREHRLLVQRCADCGTLRHPPGPACGDCASFAWDTVEASGAAVVHTHTVVHHPQVPAFDYPLTVAVVELAEGTRLIAELVGTAPGEVRIGMDVELQWIDADAELTIPAFRPARAGSS